MDNHVESPSTEDSVQGKKDQEKSARPAVAFSELFRYADGFDKFLIVTGTVGAIANGLSLPVLLILQAKLINTFGTLQSDGPKLYAETCKVPLQSFLNICGYCSFDIISLFGAKSNFSGEEAVLRGSDRPTNSPSSYCQ